MRQVESGHCARELVTDQVKPSEEFELHDAKRDGACEIDTSHADPGQAHEGEERRWHTIFREALIADVDVGDAAVGAARLAIEGARAWVGVHLGTALALRPLRVQRVAREPLPRLAIIVDKAS